MDVFRTRVPEDGTLAPLASHPSLQPTPDYGTLGPGSDIQKNSLLAAARPASRPTGGNLRLLHLIAAVLGIFCALLVSHGGTFIHTWKQFSDGLSRQKPPYTASGAVSEGDLDRQKPQRQAELLLARALSRNDNDNDGTAEQIQKHVESWRGRIAWNSQLSDLTTVALNSGDQHVRASAIEVQLAAYGLSKNDSTVDGLVRQADSSDHAKKIWALWTLGLLANRGVETDRVVQVLTAHLNGSQKDSGSANNEDARRWAVEGLSLVGTASTIEPLLAAMHDDPSGLVRERAACSLAESGMLSHEQRMIAVPKLIAYSDDSALDAQTHAWAFQALGDITKQRLPNDSAAWREWYQNSATAQ
jgi:hypothetical protein